MAKLDFGLELQEEFGLQASGEISKHEQDTTFIIDAMLALRMKLPDNCYTRMQEVIAKSGADAPKISVDRADVKFRLAELLDDKKYEKVVKEVQDFGELKANNQLNSDFIFTKTSLFRLSDKLFAFILFTIVVFMFKFDI